MSLLDKFRIRSFRVAVVALVWASVSVPVLILCAYQLRDDYKHRIAANHNELAHRAERASFILSQSLRQIMSDLDRIASDGTVIRSLTLPMLSTLSVVRLQGFLDGNSSAVNILSIDRELFPVEVLPNAALTQDISVYKGFMTDVINSAESIRDPRPRLFIANNNARQLTFIRPILAANNSVTQPFVVVGLLFTNISIDKLIEELGAKTQIGNDFLQISSQGRIIFAAGLPVEKALQQSAIISLGRDDQTLEIVLGNSSQGVMGQVLNAYRIQGVIAVIFIGLMFFVTKVLADKLGRPLRVLSQLTNAISQGGFEQYSPNRIDVDSIDYQEFTEVFGLLGKMQSTIREQFSQLYEANANLEDKVAQRTEALEQNIRLLDKQRESLGDLVRYSIEVQQAGSLEEGGALTLNLAEKICEQKVGLYLLRSESFSGYQHYSSLKTEYRQFLLDHTYELNDYTGLLRFAKDSLRLQFFVIGSSTASYQGFLVTEKSERSNQTNEALMVLCTMLGSAIKQHNLNNKLNRLAHIDSVTHLPNRHYFNAKFNDKVGNFNEADLKSHFGVFVIDVNGLKTVNDSYGHHYGDEMLQIIASAIKKLARANDTVARVGGDEFYIILEKANADVCSAFSDRLREVSSLLSMNIAGKMLPLSFSFGFASTDRDSLKNLVQLADERMYFEKKKYYRQN